MESLELRVLSDALTWFKAGHAVTLVTVVETWGSAPRPPGALLAVRDDGRLSGSVSGGCVEDDLIARLKAVPGATDSNSKSSGPTLITYGVSQQESARFGLPCGGTLRLVQEPLRDATWVATVLANAGAQKLIARTLNLATGAVTLGSATRGQVMQFDGVTLTTVFGPAWRLLLIGAGQLSQAVAHIAALLDFDIVVCDPREEFALTLAAAVPGSRRMEGMPDDVVRELQPDAHTAVVTLTHDPKLDDLALLEALQSDAFYVGALGSRRSQEARKRRLAEHFGLNAAQLARLHGPVGLALGAKTPAEIAVAIVAEIIEIKRRVVPPMPAPHPE